MQTGRLSGLAAWSIRTQCSHTAKLYRDNNLAGLDAGSGGSLIEQIRPRRRGLKGQTSSSRQICYNNGNLGQVLQERFTRSSGPN